MAQRKPDEFDKVYASEAQIKENEAHIKSMERMLEQDKKSWRNRISDEGLFMEDINKRKKLIEDYKAREIKGQKGNKAFAEAKELAERIKDAMPSAQEYFRPYPTKGTTGHQEIKFEETVKRQVRFQQDQNLQRDIKRYKEKKKRGAYCLSWRVSLINLSYYANDLSPKINKYFSKKVRNVCFFFNLL